MVFIQVKGKKENKDCLDALVKAHFEVITLTGLEGSTVYYIDKKAKNEVDITLKSQGVVFTEDARYTEIPPEKVTLNLSEDGFVFYKHLKQNSPDKLGLEKPFPTVRVNVMINRDLATTVQTIANKYDAKDFASNKEPEEVGASGINVQTGRVIITFSVDKDYMGRLAKELYAAGITYSTQQRLG